MKFTCPYSGLEFTCTYFAGMRETPMTHPIFELPTKSLLARARDFHTNTITREERRLLYLATLHSSGMVEWRVSATPSDALILQSYQRLVHTMGWLCMYDYNAKLARRVGPAFPKFVISKDTRNLSNIAYWLDCWEDAKSDYESGMRRESTIERMKRRENSLLKLVRTPSKTQEDYAWLLAQWAADAAEFPTNIEVNIADSGKMSLKDYWILLMTDKNIYGHREQDYQELIEHLEDNLEHGSTYAHEVMKLVRGKLSRQKSSLGLGDIFNDEELEKLANNPFTIITDSIEKENVRNLAVDAPLTEPARANFKTLVDYLNARAKWLLSKQIRRN